MAGSVNKAIIVGTMGRDPEVRTFPDGGSVVNLSVVTDNGYTDKKTGKYVERPMWHNIVIRNKHFQDVATKRLGKGSKVYIEGAVEYRSYTKDGQDRQVTEIVLPMFGGDLQDMGRPSGGSRQDNDAGDDIPL